MVFFGGQSLLGIGFGRSKDTMFVVGSRGGGRGGCEACGSPRGGCLEATLQATGGAIGSP